MIMAYAKLLLVPIRKYSVKWWASRLSGNLITDLAAKMKPMALRLPVSMNNKISRRSRIPM